MVDYNATLYQFPQEVWDAATCAKLAKHVAKDGLGTPYPFKGYLGGSASMPPKFGEIRYNGGCIHDGEWYQGESRPLPALPPEYEIIWVPTWGFRLVNKEDDKQELRKRKRA